MLLDWLAACMTHPHVITSLDLIVRWRAELSTSAIQHGGREIRRCQPARLPPCGRRRFRAAATIYVLGHGRSP